MSATEYAYITADGLPSVNNPILMTDSYKLGHWDMLDDTTTAISSYEEPRAGARFEETPVFGLQPLLKDHFVGKRVTKDHLEEARELSYFHHGSDDVINVKMWKRIIEEFDGFLPLSIRAVPEGTPIPAGNLQLSVMNTDDCPISAGGCAPLTNHFESLLLHTWNESTVAALSRAAKKMIASHLDRTVGNRNMLPYMLHDFGYRGGSSDESVRRAGSGHLLNFYGTDTLQAVQQLRRYYGADPRKGIIGFSVYATEHMVMTQKGREGQFDVVKAILQKPKFQKGIISMVGDSYDIYEFVATLCQEPFRSMILNRQPDAFGLCKLVIRPDSKTERHPIPGDQMAELSHMLAAGFGSSANSKGFRSLNPKVGLLWGDGIDPIDGINEILTTTSAAGFAADNYVFGCGGGLVQKVNRDVQRYAFKCSAQRRNGQWYDVYKEPIDKSKASKRGLLKVVQASPSAPLRTVRVEEPGVDLTQEVFRNGKLLREWTFEEVRANANTGF